MGKYNFRTQELEEIIKRLEALEEYKIYLDTLEAVIDTIYYAKTKMKGMSDNEDANT